MSKHVDHIGDLVPDPKNARKHNPRNIGMLEDALHEVGAARSIVIDENNVILAGNGVVEAAAQAGIEAVKVVEADGNTIIAVRRTGLSDQQKTRLALMDNRVAELADWDAEVLKAMMENDPAVVKGLWREDEIAELLKLEVEPKEAPEAKLDKAEELREVWNTQPGQLWIIPSKSVPGKAHRLLCGDSTKPEDVARLMDGEKAALLATDPPYNVGIDYGESVDDRKVLEEYQSFSGAWFLEWQRVSDRQIVTPGYYNLASWMRLFPKPYHIAPWTKTNSMTRGHVSQWACFEPVLFYGDKWTRTRPNDVFDFPVSNQQGVANHPCPKPLGMWVDLLENYSESGDLVADAFDGSGTMLAAAEQTGRIAYCAEKEPKYIAVALERMAGMNLEPRLSHG